MKANMTKLKDYCTVTIELNMNCSELYAASIGTESFLDQDTYSRIGDTEG